MDEKVVVDKINRVLEEADCLIEVRDISDVENFLSDRNNIKLEVYEVVEQLYSQLMEDIDIENENQRDTWR